MYQIIGTEISKSLVWAFMLKWPRVKLPLIFGEQRFHFPLMTFVLSALCFLRNFFLNCVCVLQLSVIIHCYCNWKTFITTIRNWGGDAFYNLVIKSPFLAGWNPWAMNSCSAFLWWQAWQLAKSSNIQVGTSSSFSPHVRQAGRSRSCLIILPRGQIELWYRNDPWGLALFQLPKWFSGKESNCHCRRCKGCWFGPWVGKIPWRRKWQPTPVFLPGKSHGQRSLAGYSSWGHKESDMAEQLSVHPAFVSGTGSSTCISKLLLLLLARPKREFLSYLHRKNR